MHFTSPGMKRIQVTTHRWRRWAPTVIINYQPVTCKPALRYIPKSGRPCINDVSSRYEILSLKNRPHPACPGLHCMSHIFKRRLLHFYSLITRAVIITQSYFITRGRLCMDLVSSFSFDDGRQSNIVGVSYLWVL